MQVTLSIYKVVERKIGDVEGLDKNEMKNVQGKLGTKKREFDKSNSLFVVSAGIEPATQGFSVLCSTD